MNWLRKPPAEPDPQRAISDEGYALGLRIADELAKNEATNTGQHERDVTPAAATAGPKDRLVLRRDPAMHDIWAAWAREADREDREAGS